MEIPKIAAALLLLTASTSSSVAGNLCDAACTLTVDYPDGGSIDAVESLTITFGADGLVDTIGSVTSYLDAETLVLNAGESLTFEAGGSFDIGTEGNIDYTDMTFNGGIIEIGATGGTETIEIPADATLTLSNGVELNFNSNLNNEGTLAANGGSLISLSGNFTGTNTGTISIDGATSGGTLSGGTLSGGTLSGGTLTVVGGTLTLPDETLTFNGTLSLDTAGLLVYTTHAGELIISEDTIGTAETPDEIEKNESSDDGSDGVFGAAASPGFPALLSAIFLLLSVSRRLAEKPR